MLIAIQRNGFIPSQPRKSTKISIIVYFFCFFAPKLLSRSPNHYSFFYWGEPLRAHFIRARVGLSAPSPSLRASRLLGGSAAIPLAQDAKKRSTIFANSASL
jgi:hypothetical protein